METQQDTTVRMVALANLQAMCARASGMCHRYWVAKVSPIRVYVAYSNPDEYGNEFPMQAVFPCFPSGWHGDSENPRVVLEILRVIGDRHDGEGWQSFMPILDGEPLYRSGKPGQCLAWKTEAEIRREQAESLRLATLDYAKGLIDTGIPG